MQAAGNGGDLSVEQGRSSGQRLVLPFFVVKYHHRLGTSIGLQQYTGDAALFRIHVQI